jgi:hypothetical protein
VGVLTDYDKILEQHVRSIVLTNPNERVMLPNYGFGMEQKVFNPTVDVAASVTASDIQTQIQAWEPSIQVKSVNVATDPATPNLVIVVIEYSVIPFNSVNGVTITVGGTLGQVSAP